MNRREFMLISTGASSLLNSYITHAATPCAPSPVTVNGGTSAKTTCSPANAESDWLARTQSPGVIWAHDFRNPSEVDKFRWVGGWGNDYNSTHSKYCNYTTADKITGTGCLEITIPTGGIADAGWWRPFSALPGDIGYTSGPAWDETNRGQNEAWDQGYYGHTDYQDSRFSGTDFYIQFRVKIQGTRIATGNPDGKLAMIMTTQKTPVHELVMQDRKSRVLYMYTGFGSPGPYEFLVDPQDMSGNPNSWQPGAYKSTCVDGQHNAANCWAFPLDEWVTVLFHITPGHGNYGDYNGPADNGIEIWAARNGETSYTKVYDKKDYRIQFDSSKPKAWNAFMLSGYMNNVPAATGWYHRYTQVIFSRQFIACPMV